jgi:hypothetical protein
MVGNRCFRASVAIEIRGGVHTDGQKLNIELPSGRLGGLKDSPVCGCGGRVEDAEPRRARHGCFQELELLRRKLGPERRHPGDVPAGARKARDMADAYGVEMRREDDGDRRGCPSGLLGLGRRVREDDVDLHTDQLGGRFVQLLDRVRPPEFDDEVLAFDVTEIAQARPECLDYDHRISIRGAAEAEVSEARTSGLLLCACNQRPRDQPSARNRDHLAAPHCPVRRFHPCQSHHDPSLVTGLPNAAVSSRERANASQRSAPLRSWAATSMHCLALDRDQSMI